jgi:class 3 adenylate cyclase/pimeloyl-ACP methyl ester carboxylesterase
VAEPATRYALTPDGAHIAYQLNGDGPVDLLFLTPAMAVDTAMEGRHFSAFIRRLGNDCRVIRFDRRGTGLSDRLPSLDADTYEQWMADFLAVLDATGTERVAVFGESPGAPLALLFAASHPERVSHLILFNGFAYGLADGDYPGWSPEQLEQFSNSVVAGMVEGTFAHVLEVPAVAGDEAFDAWYVKATRHGISPAMLGAFIRSARSTDLRPILSTISAPTLVLHRESQLQTAWARYLADHITDAKVVGLPGRDFVAFVGDVEPVLAEISSFLTGQRPPPEPDRVLATVVFTDIVDSTRRAAEAGDRTWKALLGDFRASAAEALSSHGGREVNRRGDDILASFDGPARAVRYACAIRQTALGLGLEVRSGLHTGEVELMGDDIGGIGVHIGARVAGVARAGQVLVSSTVKDLVIGSGLQFEDRGEQELRGVPGRWRLFEVLS